MNNLINRNAELRGISEEMLAKRQAEFVISSEAVDSYGTVFKMDGWKLERYNRNPVVSYNHSIMSGNPDNIIGTSTVFVEDGKLIGRVTFEPADENPLAEKVYNKIKRGTLKMASIGAIPVKGDWGKKDKGENPDVLYFREQELIEWSVVPVGANPEAHKRNEEAIADYKNKIIREIEVQEPEVIKPVKANKSVFEAQIIINKNQN
jgi:HK97 family phage prohead protease